MAGRDSPESPASPQTVASIPVPWFTDLETFRELEGEDHGLLVTSSDNAAIALNSLIGVRDRLKSDDIYTKMVKAHDYSEEISLVHRLAKFRAELWGRGFEIVHPHPTIQQAYRRLDAKHHFSLAIPEMMYDLSTVNNACLIWRGNGELDELRFYRPGSTRIDIVGRTLWLKPSADLAAAIQDATAEDLEKYVKAHSRNREYVEKWIEAIKNVVADNPKYTGFVPLREDEDEYYQLIRGSGGFSANEYSPVSMQTIFTDIELLKMLVDGDWETAYLLKNMFVLVTVGESITGGGLAGSRRNWAKRSDLTNLKTQFEKTGKAQMIYGNHTIKIEFAHPEPSVFSPEKYSAVISRVCTYFGVGEFMIRGAGTAEPGSYSLASWNVQEIRNEAQAMRELVTEHLKQFFSHRVIQQAAFAGLGNVYWHDAIDSINGSQLRMMENNFADFTIENLGRLEYSTDGFASVKEIPIRMALSDISAIIVGVTPPENATPGNYRLVMTGPQVISLMGPPYSQFNERSLKEDRQAMQEIQLMLQQGPLTNLTALQELGWKFEKEVPQKMREHRMGEILYPVFEKNQGLLDAVILGALEEGKSIVDSRGKQGPGRPTTRSEGESDTNPQPRPATASVREITLGIDSSMDLSSMTDEIAGLMEIAVWKSLKAVPARLKKLHGIRLSLSQINAIAKHAEGAESGGAESGWAVAIKHFLDTHVVKNKRWVKKKAK